MSLPPVCLGHYILSTSRCNWSQYVAMLNVPSFCLSREAAEVGVSTAETSTGISKVQPGSHFLNLTFFGESYPETSKLECVGWMGYAAGTGVIQSPNDLMPQGYCPNRWFLNCHLDFCIYHLVGGGNPL